MMKYENIDAQIVSFDRRMERLVADDSEPIQPLPVDAIESRLDNMQTWRERPI